MGEVGCLKDGNFQNLQVENTTTADFGTALSAGTDGTDVEFKQFDGHSVARIFDGATNLDTGADVDLTEVAAGKGGFGFKNAVFNAAATSDDAHIAALTLAHSGSVILITGNTEDQKFTLPEIDAGEEGFHITFVVTTTFSDTHDLCIGTAGSQADNNDTIYLYTQVATGVAVDATGDTVVTVDDVPAGTMFEFLAVKGGAAEQWICKAYQISLTAPSNETTFS